MRSKPLAYPPHEVASAWCASHGTPPAGATGEDVIYMHNELIRGESVEPILLGGRLLGGLCAIDLIGRLWLDQLAALRLAVVRCLRLGCCRRDRCGRNVERLRCAPGETGLASAARSARRLAQLASTPSRATFKTRRCGL